MRSGWSGRRTADTPAERLLDVANVMLSIEVNDFFEES
jgi:hypothetical protein